MIKKGLSIGVDLGGTKLEVALIDSTGVLRHRQKILTKVSEGPSAVAKDIIDIVIDMKSKTSEPIVGVGIGIAGQIDPKNGAVFFAPNLKWYNVPLADNLFQELQIPIYVTNDVRAATWGEWLFGAGKGCNELVCIFIGTGVGSGIVTKGEILTGYTNSAGEIGHMTIDLKGPICTCGNRGCLEALASGWALAKIATEAVKKDPLAGKKILEFAQHDHKAISAKIVIQAAKEGDVLASTLVEDLIQALIAGIVGVVNAFNPARLILGGGIVDGLPEIIPRVSQGLKERALESATKSLEIYPAILKGEAGVIGAAALAQRMFQKSLREAEI